MNSKSSLLIVAPPGDLQIGLQALLTTHLDIDVLVVGKAQYALSVIERNNPHIVIIDQNISCDAFIELVQLIKNKWPTITCVVLTNDDLLRQKIIDAGTDLIVIKGFPGVKLVAEIKRLLGMDQIKYQENVDE